MGSFFSLRGKLRVQVKVVDVETSATLGGVNSAASLDDFLTIEGELVAGLTKTLVEAAGKRAAAAARPAVPASQPAAAGHRPARPAHLKGSVAARYGRALDAKDRGDLEKARTELAAVVKEQPDFDLASYDLAALAK